MRILIAEDDEKVLKFVLKGFKEQGIVAEGVRDGREAYFRATQEQYDCIVLDIMMPHWSGLEVLAEMRKKNLRTPVLFLTAKDAVGDRVTGLEAGADDYLTKPFAFSELLARVRALTRRGQSKPASEFAVGDLSLDPVKRRVIRAGRPVELTPKEFMLLQFMMERAGEAVTRTTLTEQVWGYDFDTMTNVIDVHIRKLREKIDEPFDRPLIHTLRGVGYILEDRR